VCAFIRECHRLPLFAWSIGEKAAARVPVFWEKNAPLAKETYVIAQFGEGCERCASLALVPLQ
jgi:hypothetical protein